MIYHSTGILYSQSINFSGVNSHMQLQFRNFPELCLYSYSSFLSVDYFHIQVVRLQAPARSSPSSSLFSCPIVCHAVAVSEQGCRASKIPGKTALLGAERTESLEKQHFWVQSEQSPWKKQSFWVQSEQNPWKKQHFWVQSELNPWKQQHFWEQSEQNPWKTAFLGAEKTLEKNILGRRANNILGNGLDWYTGEIYYTGEISEGAI